MCDCFLELCPFNKYFEVKTVENKNDGNTSETRDLYVFLVELLW